MIPLERKISKSRSAQYKHRQSFAAHLRHCTPWHTTNINPSNALVFLFYRARSSRGARRFVFLSHDLFVCFVNLTDYMRTLNRRTIFFHCQLDQPHSLGLPPHQSRSTNCAFAVAFEFGHCYNTPTQIKWKSFVPFLSCYCWFLINGAFPPSQCFLSELMRTTGLQTHIREYKTKTIKVIGH